MFKNALASVQHCYKALIVYAAVTAGYLSLKIIIETYLIQGLDTTNPESLSTQYYLTTGLLDAFFYSLAAALAFLILGREVDKPLWKHQSNLSNILGFFSLWFTLHLMSIAFLLFIILTNIPSDTQASLYIFWKLGYSLLIPFGATIMFYGQMTRHTVSQALNTMMAQLPFYVASGFSAFFLYNIISSIHNPSLPYAIIPILQTVSAYFECVLFAFCWEICKKHRDELENSDDFDF